MLNAHAELDVETTLEVAFAVIWDVARYPDFLSDVMDASVEVSDGRVIGTLDVRVFRARRLRLELWRDGVTRMAWKLVEGEHLRAVDGSWTLLELAPGLVRMTYDVGVELDFDVPDAIARRFTDFGLPTVIRQFKARIEGANLLGS